MSDELTATLRARLLHDGAALVGFADLSMIPAPNRQDLPRAVSVAVALDPAVVAGLADGPTAAYFAEYERANTVLARLAAAAVTELTGRGFQAAAGAVTVKAVHGDGATALPHKTVATRAGLGWIGHAALLITPDYGAAVRLASVLTDAPLATASPVDESRCGTCRACVDACPANAVTGQPWHAGIARERLVDVRACMEKVSALTAARGIDTLICGICILACPWTRRYLRRAGVRLPE